MGEGCSPPWEPSPHQMESNAEVSSGSSQKEVRLAAKRNWVFCFPDSVCLPTSTYLPDCFHPRLSACLRIGLPRAAHLSNIGQPIGRAACPLICPFVRLCVFVCL